MRIDLTGKTALVTGSSSGIGQAIARGLAEAGANVILHGRSSAKLDKIQTQLAAAHPLAQFPVVAADIGTAEGAAAIIKAHPDVDILINNAGIFEPRDFAEIDDERWQTMMDVNVMSGVRLSRHYLPRMIKANWGRIVFISSESGLNIPAEMIHYGVSKTAQLAVSRGLAQLTAGSGVTVNAVLPGPTRSDGVGDFFGKIAEEQGISQAQVEQDFIQTHRPTSLIKRLANVEEVANMVVYVSSPQASATNGAALRVDGGVVNFIA
ncbi:SDR family NAD(P)-dependent oxidoreductase [Silvimonas iriomotensis]|uniref:Oxidoreductase n=1 Tax=Silvimonas iriomotensis TaxID=449662 RepID=A0ABQ2PAL3_9NEIS|nr:SDR family oxidoreductase [Silvimonas iriomotensis]GGP22061.1 oxidoreductase [Silvimonas iriomotensis]